MKKEIKICEETTTIYASAYTPILYRESFGRDVFADISIIRETKDIKQRIAIAARLLFVMQRQRNSFNKITTKNLLDIVPELIKLWNFNMQCCVDRVNSTENHVPLTVSLYLLRCIQLGLSIDDLKQLTVGMILDVYTELENNKNDNNPVHEATQEDMDRF